MTEKNDTLHVYERSIRDGERTSLSVIGSLARPGARVLDLGCGSGSLGRYLAETKRCVVDGLTLNEAEAALARPYYRRVEVADLETADLLGLFGAGQYDHIVCADVLEHLRRPETLLNACEALLAPGGRLLYSIPNAAYSGLIAELMQGEIRYRPEGLLDATHLRFFTRRSLWRFFGHARWQIEAMETIERALPESEFRSAFDALPPAVARYLLGAPDALTYQLVGSAYPHPQPQLPPEATQALPEAAARFTCELYLRRSGVYAEARKRTQSGVVGLGRQTLRFALDAGLDGLRLDLADRPGFMHLFALRLLAADGSLTWEWDARSDAGDLLQRCAHHHLVSAAPQPSVFDGIMLLLSGDDPWLELPVPPSVWHGSALAQGGTLEVDLGWPMSADYLALSQSVRPLQEALRHTREQATQEREQLQARLADTAAALALARQRADGLEATNLTLNRERAQLQDATRRIQQDFDALAQHLRTIENSTVFRATRPIVHAKMRIDRWLGRGTAPASTTTLPPTPTPITPPAQPVDVIVPVYRGLEDTRRCIESVLSSSCHTDYRLVVINDASPEPEVTAWLRERAATDARITLLENEHNLGFVGTVNRGMALNADHDVLLLNSDTEVANDWLDRIRRAAYADRRIASVTPFSNNATICSYPRFCADNALPSGYDTARLDALCRDTLAGQAVDVPTGVGFCMYLRRDALSDVGLFDTEHFGKGYGEENDFCQRAANRGWRNLHLLDTFVLHTGGVSFGASKSPREIAAMETLRRLHPGYEPAVHRFVQEDPAREARLQLDLARMRASGLPVVLAVLHDRGGGTLRHVRELAAQLADRCTTLTLSPRPQRCVALKWAGEQEAFELLFRLDDQWDDLLATLRAVGVRHVHYHHLLGHEAPMLSLAAQLGVRYDFTAHDYYSFCTRISMTGNDNRFQGEPVPGLCACCQPHDQAPDGGTVEAWRNRHRDFLRSARYVIAPSADTARRMADFAPGARVLAVPHPEPVLAQPPAPHAPRVLDSSATLKVAVIGALSAIKGADVLEAVALEAARQRAPVEFHLLGYGYRHLQTQPRSHLTVHGPYAEDDLTGLLRWLQPDLVWFPAQWPETYSYTLSASLAEGLPVLVPDIGAMAERVAGRPWSWIAPWDQTPGQWLQQILALREAHFATGAAPAGAPGTAPTYPDWHYTSTYLQDWPSPAITDTPAVLDAAFLRAHAPRQQPANAAKGVLLETVVRLRSHPLLRGVARRIPLHWQRRVKSWLQR